MKTPPDIPSRAALDAALSRLMHRLEEARSYLRNGSDLAALGALLALDEFHGDIAAAARLFKREVQQ